MQAVDQRTLPRWLYPASTRSSSFKLDFSQVPLKKLIKKLITFLGVSLEEQPRADFMWERNNPNQLVTMTAVPLHDGEQPDQLKFETAASLYQTIVL